MRLLIILSVTVAGQRRDADIGCDGSCTNLVVCSLTGGKAISGSCSGILSVCCRPKSYFSPLPSATVPVLARVPRQLHNTLRRLPLGGKRLQRLPRPTGPPPSRQSKNPKVIRTNQKEEVISIPVHKSRTVIKPAVSQSSGHALQTTVRESGARSKFNSDFVSDTYKHELYNEIPDFSWEECGLSQQYAEERILGGQDAGFGQFPWTAVIQVVGQGLDKMCAGSLVNNRFILTAGHCVRYCSDSLLPNCSHPIPFSDLTFKVVLGEYDVNSKHKENTIQRFYAINVFIHPDFMNIFRLRDNGFLESEPRNDVALLMLDREVKPSPNIGSICLPPSDLVLESGTQATVTGWGRLGVHEGAPHSSTLQATTVPVLTREECREQPGASVPSSDQLCAGLSNARKSSCPGDSGGGLMLRDETFRWIIIGIVSTGPAECGLTPVIYHNVIFSIDWIKNTINQARKL